MQEAGKTYQIGNCYAKLNPKMTEIYPVFDYIYHLNPAKELEENGFLNGLKIHALLKYKDSLSCVTI